MDNELKTLRKELAVLGNEFSQRVKVIEQRIDHLEAKHIWAVGDETSGLLGNSTGTPTSNSQINQSTNLNSHPTIDVAINKNKNVQTTPSVIAVPENNEAVEETARVTFSSEEKLQENVFQPKTKAVQPKSKPSQEPSGWELDATAQEAGRQSLFTILAPLFGPFAALCNFFSTVYLHYQKQGKAPVFFMTVTGIVALVLGFGYLLQYSFNEYLGPVGKVIIGFVCAFAVTAGGVRITRKSDGMAEYGSSIIALGVILSFLCAYFAGPYYNLLPSFWAFLLLAGVTVVAYMLALQFETRVVAIVTLVGGVAMPIVMGHIDFSPQLYLSYLLVLAVAMLNLAQRIQWPQLALVTMVLSAGMIEFSVVNREIMSDEPFGLIAIIHGFFYAFGYFSLKGLSDSAMSKPRLLVISSNILFYIFVSQQLVLSSTILGVMLLINTLPWIALFILPNKVFRYTAASEAFRTVQALALLHAGILAGVGILVLSRPELMGVIWCVEALMLIYLGSKFHFISVRVEGYVALLISILTMGAHVATWLFEAVSPAPVLLNLELNIGWANLIALTVLVYGAVMLMQKQQAYLLDKELQLIPVLENLLSFGLSLSFLLTVGIFLGQVMWLLAAVPMFYLIWRSKNKGLVITELLGLSHLLLLIVPMVSSAAVVGHFHFSDQSIYAQIARLELFVALWLIAEFYSRYFPESHNIRFTEGLRKIFYCSIPLLFLPKVLREYSDHYPIALWLSSVIALALYSRLKYRVLMIELRVLVSVASVSAIVSCVMVEFSNWSGNAIGALGVGLLFYILTGWYGQALRVTPLGSDSKIQLNKALKPMFSLAVYYFGLALFVITYKVSYSVEFGMLMSLFYFVSYFFVKAILAPVRTTLSVAYFVISVLFVLLTLSNSLYAVSNYYGEMKELTLGFINSLAVATVGMLLFRPRAQVRAVWQHTGGRIVNIWAFNLITIAAYVSLLSQLFTDMLGPIVSFFLVAHATIILFLTLESKFKKLIWLSGLLFGAAAIKVLLWDMSDFTIIQKVVVFMLIGICMLGAAFKFQKIAARDTQLKEY